MSVTCWPNGRRAWVAGEAAYGVVVEDHGTETDYGQTRDLGVTVEIAGVLVDAAHAQLFETRLDEPGERERFEVAAIAAVFEAAKACPCCGAVQPAHSAIAYCDDCNTDRCGHNERSGR